jgi:hypothetical protein
MLVDVSSHQAGIPKIFTSSWLWDIPGLVASFGIFELNNLVLDV